MSRHARRGPGRGHCHLRYDERHLVVIPGSLRHDSRHCGRHCHLNVRHGRCRAVGGSSGHDSPRGLACEGTERVPGLVRKLQGQEQREQHACQAQMAASLCAVQENGKDTSHICTRLAGCHVDGEGVPMDHQQQEAASRRSNISLLTSKLLRVKGLK